MSQQSWKYLNAWTNNTQTVLKSYACFSFHTAYTKLRYPKWRVLELKAFIYSTLSV